MAQASSGRVSTSGHNTGYFFLDWSISQSISGNYSDVSWKAYCHVNSGYTFYSNGVVLNSVVIGGTTVSGQVKASNISGEDRLLNSGTHRIYHNNSTGASGNITFSITGQLYWGSPTYKQYSNSGTWSFPTIPRNPSLTVASFSSNPVSISCTWNSNLDLSSFKYRIYGTDETPSSTAGWIDYDISLGIVANATTTNNDSFYAEKTYRMEVQGTASASGLSSTAYKDITTQTQSKFTTGTATSIVLPDSAGTASVTVACKLTNPYRVYGQTVSVVDSAGTVYGTASVSTTDMNNTGSDNITPITITISNANVRTLYSKTFSLTNYSDTEKRFTLTLQCTHARRTTTQSLTVRLLAANCGPTGVDPSKLYVFEGNSAVAQYLTGQVDLGKTLSNASAIYSIRGQSQHLVGANDPSCLLVKANSGSTLQSLTIFGKTLARSAMHNTSSIKQDGYVTDGVISVVATDNRGFTARTEGRTKVLTYYLPTVSSLKIDRCKIEGSTSVTEETGTISFNGSFCRTNFGKVTNTPTLTLLLKTKKTSWNDRGASVTAGCLIQDGTVYSFPITSLATITSTSVASGNSVDGTFVATEKLLTIGGAPIKFTLGVEYDAILLAQDQYIIQLSTGDAPQKSTSILSGQFIFSAQKGKGICFAGLYDDTQPYAVQLNGLPMLGFYIEGSL